MIDMTPFQDRVIKIKQDLNNALSSSSYDAETYSDLLTECLKVDREHNSDTEDTFYHQLFDQILESIQDPTAKNIEASSALRYLSFMEFAGYAPNHTVETLTGVSHVSDVDVFFNIIAEDADTGLEPTLALRAAIKEDGTVRLIHVNTSFLTEPGRVRMTELNKGKDLTSKDLSGFKPVKKGVEKDYKAADYVLE